LKEIWRQGHESLPGSAKFPLGESVHENHRGGKSIREEKEGFVQRKVPKESLTARAKVTFSKAHRRRLISHTPERYLEIQGGRVREMGIGRRGDSWREEKKPRRRQPRKNSWRLQEKDFIPLSPPPTTPPPTMESLYKGKHHSASRSSGGNFLREGMFYDKDSQKGR